MIAQQKNHRMAARLVVAMGLAAGCQTVDQTQLRSETSYEVMQSSDTTLTTGQTWTVGQSGLLSGIEVSMCANTSQPLALVVDVGGQQAPVSVPQLPTCAPGTTAPPSLSSSVGGPGYFVITPSIPVSAGDTAGFTVLVPPNSQSAGNFAILGGVAAPDRYPGGQLLQNSLPIEAPTSTADLAFKTVFTPYTVPPVKRLTIDVAADPADASAIFATVGTSVGPFLCPSSGSVHTCTASFPPGTTVSLTSTVGPATALEDYAGDCTGRTCTVTMSADRHVTATFGAGAPLVVHMVADPACGPSPQGTVTSAPEGLSCAFTDPGPTTCSANFPLGSPVSLTSAPDAQTTFVGFTGSCEGPSCDLVMDDALDVTADFCGSAGPG